MIIKFVGYLFMRIDQFLILFYYFFMRINQIYQPYSILIVMFYINIPFHISLLF
ncbi:hypothetical protein NBO_31g0006 [Nosema bombycis CQ1]|uniref:Uncharacterized protein n=1 Tax=Nosema bombycis (strain CQ1 / CVCC 102059) TaxID=578461 RepID=R0KVP9_NOSB1|nr:hypothetical protein NBO_31g0006 [Nosema bombycis CQ1]|eukprot:EOB14287.1 hypothetical protein NBO_31g0006 [Nosema bombycis CQ1]